jgi:hypothetical protein
VTSSVVGVGCSMGEVGTGAGAPQAVAKRRGSKRKWTSNESK